MDERATKWQAEKDKRSGAQSKPKRAEPAGRDGARPADADLAVSPPLGHRADEAVPAEQSVVAGGVGGTSVATGDAVVGGGTGSGGPTVVAGEDEGMKSGVTSLNSSEGEVEQQDGSMSGGENTALEIEGLVSGVASPGMLSALMSGLSSGEEEEEEN